MDHLSVDQHVVRRLDDRVVVVVAGVLVEQQTSLDQWSNLGVVELPELAPEPAPLLLASAPLGAERRPAAFTMTLGFQRCYVGLACLT